MENHIEDSESSPSQIEQAVFVDLKDFATAEWRPFKYVVTGLVKKSGEAISIVSMCVEADHESLLLR